MANLIPSGWKSPLERLRTNIHAALDRWTARGKTNEWQEAESWPPALFATMDDPIDIDDRDDEIIARAVMPGLDPDDFTVEVSEDRLVIRGGKQRSVRKQGHGFSRFEETSAAFAKAVALPCQVDRDRVAAKYKSGVLTVTLPKTQSARRQRKKISVA